MHSEFKITRKWFAILLFSLSFVSTEMSNAVGFTAKGTCDFGWLNNSGKESFSVTVSDCTWSIETFPDTRYNKDIVSYKQIFDGTNLISVALYDQKITNNIKTLNNAAGTVEADSVPNGRIGSHLGSVWMAYASQCYLANARQKRAEPIWEISVQERREHATLPAVWTLATNPPYLPQAIDYYDEGFVRMLQEGNGQPKKRRKPPFENGYRTADYVTLTWTNIGDLTIPLTFAYHYYLTKPNAKTTNDIQVSFTIEGSLSSVSLTPETNVEKAIITGVTLLEDYRTSLLNSNVTKIRYSVSNNTIPEKQDLLKRAEFKREVINASVRQKIMARVSPFTKAFWLLFVPISCLFLLFWMRARKMQK